MKHEIKNQQSIERYCPSKGVHTLLFITFGGEKPLDLNNSSFWVSCNSLTFRVIAIEENFQTRLTTSA